MASTFIPPGGFAGVAQQTPAVLQLYRGGKTGKAGTKRRRRRASTPGNPSYASRMRRARRTRRTADDGPAPKFMPGRSRKSSRKRATLVKGSAAARRRMAQLRGMRRRK